MRHALPHPGTVWPPVWGGMIGAWCADHPDLASPAGAYSRSSSARTAGSQPTRPAMASTRSPKSGPSGFGAGWS